MMVLTVSAVYRCAKTIFSLRLMENPATFVRAIGHCDTATEVGSHHEENDDEAMMLENDKRKIKKTSSFIHEKSASAFCCQP